MFSSSIWFEMLCSKYFDVDISFEMLGLRCLIPNIWFEMLGSKNLVVDTWFEMLGLRCLIRNLWFKMSQKRMDIFEELAFAYSQSCNSLSLTSGAMTSIQ